MIDEEEKEKIKKELERIKLLKNYEGEDRVVSTLEMKDVVEEEKKKIVFSIPTPFKELTECIEGFHNGQLITIAGLSGEGKTSLCQTLTYHMVKNGYGALWFTYEVPEGEFLMRMPKLNEEIPVFAMPRKTKARDLDWLEDRIIEAIIKSDKGKFPRPQAVFIDSIGFLFDEGIGSVHSASLTIGSIVSKLKEIAIKYSVAIFITTNMVKNIKAKTPTGEDIRDSGRLKDYSDIVLVTWRGKEKIGDTMCYIDNSYLLLDKNRWSGKYPRKPIELQYRDNLFQEFNPEKFDIDF
jgi:replicative DNA helicase